MFQKHSKGRMPAKLSAGQMSSWVEGLSRTEEAREGLLDHPRKRERERRRALRISSVSRLWAMIMIFCMCGSACPRPREPPTRKVFGIPMGRLGSKRQGARFIVLLGCRRWASDFGRFFHVHQQGRWLKWRNGCSAVSGSSSSKCYRGLCTVNHVYLMVNPFHCHLRVAYITKHVVTSTLQPSPSKDARRSAASTAHLHGVCVLAPLSNLKVCHPMKPGTVHPSSAFGSHALEQPLTQYACQLPEPQAIIALDDSTPLGLVSAMKTVLCRPAVHWRVRRVEEIALSGVTHS